MFPSDLEEGIGLGHLMGEGAPVTAPGEERSGPSQRTEALFTEALFTEALFHRGTLSQRHSQEAISGAISEAMAYHRLVRCEHTVETVLVLSLLPLGLAWVYR